MQDAGREGCQATAPTDHGAVGLCDCAKKKMTRKR